MALLLINMLVMFILDRVTMIMGINGPFGEPGYTPFYFAGWASALVATIFAINGSVLK